MENIGLKKQFFKIFLYLCLMSYITQTVSRSGSHFILEQLESYDIKCYKFENQSSDYNIKAKCKSYNIPENTPRIIIYRDYINWLASAIKYVVERENPENIYDRIQYYIDHWMYLAKQIEANNFYLAIDYQTFKQSRPYRENICYKLKGSYTEEKLLHVPEAGGGSSFTALEFNNKADQMNTNNRWTEVQSLYPKLFNQFVQEKYLNQEINTRKNLFSL